MNYHEFLKTKEVRILPSGFSVAEDSLSAAAFDWQRHVVAWSLKRGKAALFEDCGLGKTLQQLMWAERVSAYTDKPVLIIAPLAVAPQTKLEGLKFGIAVNICETQADVGHGINITNYEKLDKFSANSFSGVVLDESSILKSYMGKTKRMIIDKFADTPYRLACTATPAPNDLMELLNHAEFLGVMKSSEALAIWFIADQCESGKYRLKGHAERDVVVGETKGMKAFEDIGRQIETSATGYHKERRRTLNMRCEKTSSIVNSDSEQYVIWCGMNDESDELKRLLPDAVEIRGSDKVQKKEQAALDFVSGKIRVLISKPSIFGYGLNFQNCHKSIFCGMDYSFESYYQAVRRFYRFGQTSPVEIIRVLGDTELNILNTINRKANMKQHMQYSMAEAMRDFQTRKNSSFQLDLSSKAYEMPAWLKGA